jgi:hypothetical protein
VKDRVTSSSLVSASVSIEIACVLKGAEEEETEVELGKMAFVSQRLFNGREAYVSIRQHTSA